jgi:hypothetical protein
MDLAKADQAFLREKWRESYPDWERMWRMFNSKDPTGLAAQVNESVDYHVGKMGKDHYVVKDPGILLMGRKDLIVTVKQAVWLENTGNLVPDEELVRLCDQENCVLHLEHRPPVSDPAAAMEDDKGEDEEEVLALVQRHTTAVTLADLYRRGRAKGLLAGGSNYH